MKGEKLKAVFCAVLAALFYAINTPFSKLLLEHVPSVFMASFLYLGAGLGVGYMYLFEWKKEKSTDRLEKKELPYTLGMILLDIAAPVFLMIGIRIGNASNASLLNNFEIVATSLIALLCFKEKISKKLWTAIILITVASIILSFEGSDGLSFSFGSLFVLLAALCWGLENNCTRSISTKSTYQIVTIKGLCSGTGSIIIACILKEKLPGIEYIVQAMLLGFVAYGLSIFAYIRAQATLGAAKTSAYYAITPFIGTALAFVLLGDKLTVQYVIALIVMIIGTIFVVCDTLVQNHTHLHSHVITHTHDGYTHSHVIEHNHRHHHFIDSDSHRHNALDYVSSEEHLSLHQKGKLETTKK